MPPKSLLKIGPAYQHRCDKNFKLHKVILPMAKHHMGLASGINVAAGAFAFDILKNKALRKAISRFPSASAGGGMEVGAYNEALTQLYN